MASQGEGFCFYFWISIFQTFLLALLLLFFNWKYIVFCVCVCVFFFFFTLGMFVCFENCFVFVICLHDFFALVYILIHELKIL